MVTLNGFFEGPKQEIDWHNVDDEFNEYAGDFLDSLDMLLFGRVTYQLMANYWPTPTALHNDPIIASKMNSLPKIVFSRTLKLVDWQNTRLVKEHVPEEIARLKLQPGKDMAVFGSSNLSLTMIQYNLFDEYRLFMNPIFLGKGKPLFNGLEDRLKLRLVRTRAFHSGNVLLIYKPAVENSSSKEAFPWRTLLI